LLEKHALENTVVSSCRNEGQKGMHVGLAVPAP
jgi:hypothetical protein